MRAGVEHKFGAIKGPGGFGYEITCVSDIDGCPGEGAVVLGTDKAEHFTLSEFSKAAFGHIIANDRARPLLVPGQPVEVPVELQTAERARLGAAWFTVIAVVFGALGGFLAELLMSI